MAYKGIWCILLFIVGKLLGDIEMRDFEKKDVIVNAGFDAFMEQQKLVIGNEASRALLYEVWIGGMQFMLQQIVKEMKEVLA